MHRDIVCVGCGVKLQTGQKYCHECGEEGTRPESSTNNSRRPRSAIARWASRNLSEEQLEGKPQPELEPESHPSDWWINALIFIVPLVLYIIGRVVLRDLR